MKHIISAMKIRPNEGNRSRYPLGAHRYWTWDLRSSVDCLPALSPGFVILSSIFPFKEEEEKSPGLHPLHFQHH
ncbi:hypothetical protein H5410_016410 [Solanum commersonii]|uniref:Uncharacterized protein n=1 Tax=Solanum commersonii TaxID=4109 RepID=A0A9J5ZXA8_SOLCO|nr:hypothetical protein H5410_016410 [Solanum commersonii]